MPLPINLLKAFEKGELKPVRLNQNTRRSPEQGKCWLILTGYINFTTGTSSLFGIPTNKETANTVLATNYPAEWDWCVYIVDTTASGSIMLFSTLAGVGYPQWQPIIITSDMQFANIGGDAATYIILTVLEWIP